jgi:ATP-dependent RNA helicase DDX21
MSPALATAEPMAVDDSASKKAKRKELKAAAAAAEAEAAASRKKEKKGKKRKAKDPSPPPSDEDDSSTSSEEPAPAAKKAKKEKKAAEEKARSSSEDGGDGDGDVTACSDEDPADPNALTNFRICEPLRQSLKSKGIKALFPIQASTFDIVFDGADLVGRARTGQVRSPFELCLVSFLRFPELISAYNIGHL